MKNYDHGKIEKKWQKEWEKKGLYKTLSAEEAAASALASAGRGKKKMYVLDMFPYPSGAGLHVGHPRGYIGSDVYARMKRMEGYNVLHPMGYDGFGLPAEQYAIEHKVHPKKSVKANVKMYRSQLEKIGFSYDWSREINTTDPEYYKWTQWFFLKLYEHGLAYEGDSEVNWCEQLGTVLANDEIIEDAQGNLISERGNFPVTKKKMRQWFLKITAYADKLLDGLDKLDWPEHIKEIQKNWIGREEVDGKITYKMHDAVFARQRYWGEPIPLIHKKDGTIEAVPENKLPLKLPNVKSYEPTGEGGGPLGGVAAWVKKGYETNTMPGWAGSSWYFLRYMDPKNNNEFASKKELEYWKDVDMYVGGAEHATGHLLYARFWHKFLFDLGLVPTDEPFPVLKNQGIILSTDGRKMSKRWGNVINPDEIVKIYGADTLRVYEMFMGPFEQSLPWSTESIIGSRRFLERVWKLKSKIDVNKKVCKTDSLVHKTIKGVSDDILLFKFNTAISKMMVLVNALEKETAIVANSYKVFLQILAPFAPHITEELWKELGEEQSIHISVWPKADETLLIDDEVKIIIQVNGKLRGEFIVATNTSEEEIKKLALAHKNVLQHVEGKEIKKVIYIPHKLVNIVV